MLVTFYYMTCSEQNEKLLSRSLIGSMEKKMWKKYVGTLPFLICILQNKF